jgi:hypothetical protein
MAELTLEQRVAVLEQTVAELKARNLPAGTRWWEQIGVPFNNDPVFEEMLAYGRYFRKTGQIPPDNWNPGDPIPEPTDEGP